MLPSTVDRVPANTVRRVNEKIQRRTAKNIRRYRNASRAQIEARLEELEREWDIERTLEANAATASLVGLALGATVDRRWFAFPAICGRISPATRTPRLVPSPTDLPPARVSNRQRN